MERLNCITFYFVIFFTASQDQNKKEVKDLNIYSSSCLETELCSFFVSDWLNCKLKI